MNNFFAAFKKRGTASGQEAAVQSLTVQTKARRIFMRVSLRDQIQFIKQLATLMKAGIPLLSSLRLLKEQSRSRSMKTILDSVIYDVENGHYLATALGKFKNIFGELIINIIAIGEISGTLSGNLEHLVVTLKKKQALRRKVISASVYPIFIIIATIGITVMLTVFVFPKIIPVFESINYQLPWTTKFLIFVSAATRAHGLLIIAMVVLGIAAVWISLQIKQIREWFDNALLHAAFVKTMVRTYNVANICRTLGLLLVSGTTVVRAFHITSDTTKNLAYKKELTKIADNIVKGEIISTNLRRNGALFPLTVSQMVAVAESTGKLSDTLSYLAEVHEEEMDEITKNLSTSIEPLLLIFMGVLVGFIAISIITPIYGITQHLSPK